MRYGAEKVELTVWNCGEPPASPPRARIGAPRPVPRGDRIGVGSKRLMKSGTRSGFYYPDRVPLNKFVTGGPNRSTVMATCTNGTPPHRRREAMHPSRRAGAGPRAGLLRASRIVSLVFIGVCAATVPRAEALRLRGGANPFAKAAAAFQGLLNRKEADRPPQLSEVWSHRVPVPQLAVSLHLAGRPSVRGAGVPEKPYVPCALPLCWCTARAVLTRQADWTGPRQVRDGQGEAVQDPRPDAP